MSLFGFLKKKAPETKVEMTTHGYAPKELRGQIKERAEKRMQNLQKDEAGLYPYEILMLSYLEKYAAGKEPARFWEYDYGVGNVSALIESLEKRGFASGGRLTELGKSEIAKNEYVLYMHKHKFPDISMADMSILVNKNPGRPYRDLLWAEFNRLSGEYMGKSVGLYRNLRYEMYRFLIEEKRYKSAVGLLAEVLFYDLNGSETPFVAPRLIKDFQDLERKTDYTEEELTKEISHAIGSINPPYKNFTVYDISRIIIAYSFGDKDTAQNIFENGEKLAKSRNRKDPKFKSSLTEAQRKRANIRVK